MFPKVIFFNSDGPSGRAVVATTVTRRLRRIILKALACSKLVETRHRENGAEVLGSRCRKSTGCLFRFDEPYLRETKPSKQIPQKKNPFVCVCHCSSKKLLLKSCTIFSSRERTSTMHGRCRLHQPMSNSQFRVFGIRA
jgi:hypothetical protein